MFGLWRLMRGLAASLSPGTGGLPCTGRSVTSLWGGVVYDYYYIYLLLLLYLFIYLFILFIIIIIIIIITRGRPLHYMYPSRKCTPKTLC